MQERTKLKSVSTSKPRPRRLRRRTPVVTVHEGAVAHEKATPRARVVNRLARMFVKPAMRWLPLQDGLMVRIQSLDRPSVPAEDIVSADIDLGGVPGEELHHIAGIRTDVTMLYLHGGGFFTGSVNSYRRLLEAFARMTGGRVIAVNYRQLPEAHVAESVSDAIDAYTALLEVAVNPDRIVVAGDSAGGYLTMKVAELAARRGLTPPAALIGFSPLLSLDPDHPAKDVPRTSAMREAYLPARRIAPMRQRWLPEGAAIEGFADPFNATAYITSPTFLVAAEDEMLRPEAEGFAIRLAERGVPVEFHVWRGQVHAFPMLVAFIQEAQDAVRLSVEFVMGQTGSRDENFTEAQDSQA